MILVRVKSAHTDDPENRTDVVVSLWRRKHVKVHPIGDFHYLTDRAASVHVTKSLCHFGRKGANPCGAPECQHGEGTIQPPVTEDTQAVPTKVVLTVDLYQDGYPKESTAYNRCEPTVDGRLRLDASGAYPSNQHKQPPTGENERRHMRWSTWNQMKRDVSLLDLMESLVLGTRENVQLVKTSGQFAPKSSCMIDPRVDRERVTRNHQ